MRAPKIDANQPEIVAALREAGCTVQLLHMVGRGCPDLLVGKMDDSLGINVNLLLEVKSDEAKRNDLTPDQKKWHDSWRGQVTVVCSVNEALKAVGSAGED
jgi:hypothetical protein